jgi:hypothetical protein
MAETRRAATADDAKYRQALRADDRRVVREAHKCTSTLSDFERQCFAAIGVGRVLQMAVDEFIDRIDNLWPGRPRGTIESVDFDTPGQLAIEMRETIVGCTESVVTELMELEKLDREPKEDAS